jgi:hypothetical protein
MNKKALCEAFCEQMAVRKVPAGFAVSTPFDGFNGEPIGFYIIKDKMLEGHSYIEDDGTTIPLLEAAGIEMMSGTRGEAFADILREYKASYDEEAAVLRSEPVSENGVPEAARKFVALLLRLQDFLLLTPERVANTFREDATRQIKEAVGSRASINENQSVSTELSDFPADLVIHAQGRPPVAVFLGVTEQHVSEAVMLQMAALYEAHIECSVIALLEKDGSLTQRARQRANNRLTAVPIFRGDERAAIARIEREVFGRQTGHILQ